MIRSGLRPRLAGLAVAGLMAVSLGPVLERGFSLARFTGAATVTANAFTAGTWGGGRYYLHNNPTPPVGNTTSQANLAMNATAPAAVGLFNYDTNCDTAVGRALLRTSNGANETTACYYANWRTAILGSPLILNGSANLAVWSATRNFRTGRDGSLTAYLRDYNPGTATTIVSATLTDPDWQGGSGTWVQKSIAFPAAAYTVPTGHALELKVVASTASSRTMWLAYDTATYATLLTLP